MKSIDIHVTRPVSWYLYNDNGDNIVYPQVTLNSTNYMDISFRCKTSSGADGGGGFISQANIYPTQTGQTFWK